LNADREPPELLAQQPIFLGERGIRPPKLLDGCRVADGHGVHRRA